MTNKKKENNGFRFFLGIIILGIVIYFGMYTDEKLESNRRQEDKEYVKIDKYDKVVQGRLISKKNSKGYTGRTLMILNNNMKVSFSGLTRNYEITKADFDYFLQIGDSIYKPSYSDSIYVYRNDREYYFILGKVINE